MNLEKIINPLNYIVMAQNVNLNSIAWCDLVFEGKNKDYGAYDMRQTASKRHVTAFVVMFIALSLFIMGPALLEKSGVMSNRMTGTTDVTVISDITPFDEKEIPIDEPIAKPLPPPPAEIRKALAHTPPIIVDDATDTEGREMRSVDELNADRTVLISNTTYLEGGRTGVDPGEILGEIGGTPGGTGMVDEGPVLVPQVPAQFLGGDVELMKYLNEKIRYPQIAAENGIEGRSVVRFVVSIDGTISDVKIIKSSDPSLDKEALRVVKSMPKWIPGKVEGKNVNSYFTLPVTFRLQR